MKFDVFHSIGRIHSIEPKRSDARSFTDFFAQVELAESLGYETVWVAESHFSSEVQKQHEEPVIPNYHGEVGLNADSFLLAQSVFERTERIGFGTAILNIVGGNGGPIAAADRLRSLAWHNHLRETPRRLHIGVASGRFPYINRPFGIVPRTPEEHVLWPAVTRCIFLEALEIFLRLGRGETISSADITRHRITKDMFKDEGVWERACSKLGFHGDDGFPYEPRWEFDALKLVPELDIGVQDKFLNYVLGSHDPLARELGLKFADLDVFNLSFTPPDQLNKVHAEMTEHYRAAGRTWHRSRMPRTVLVFIDEDENIARRNAESCFDTYIEAMRGTVKLPPREALMSRALIGTPEQIAAQMDPDDAHGFDRDDRLMLWFEFNQTSHEAICHQMQLFAERVVTQFKD